MKNGLGGAPRRDSLAAGVGLSIITRQPRRMARPQHHLGIGIDTGGTFTDIVLFDFGGGAILRKAKTPTTHGDYTVCIAQAFRALELDAGETGRLARVCLSTTLATNTVAENRVHPTCLIIEPGDISIPPDAHPRLVLLRSCISFDIREVVAVSEREVLEKAGPFAAGVESFAVSGYASTRSPAHEQQIAAILSKAFRKPVVLGSDLTHQLNFLQRAQAAALNAGLLPVIMEWLGAVKAILAGLGIACPLYIVKGDGSLMEDGEALARPVQTLFSGPAASLNGGAFLSGESDAVVIDVGGTTTDMGRVRAGRGILKQGGLLINQRHIALDGLDIATFGLGGDSRFRLGGRHRFQFENRRALPVCRAVEQYPALSLAGLEEELEGQWHFGDPGLLELAAPDNGRAGRAAPDGLSETQRALLAALGQGPLTLRRLGREAGVAHIAAEVDELVRRRLLVRIALTPTDLFCAEGRIPGFSREAAGQALALNARMLDMGPEDFRAALLETVRRQACALLAVLLGAFHPPLPSDDPVVDRLVDLLLAGGDGPEPLLRLDPGQPLVLVGAAAPMLFAGVPGPLGERTVQPEHGEVANAVGAVTSRFMLRETVTVEPVKRGGVEVFDHQGKRPFATVEEGLAHARAALEQRLTADGEALGLSDTRLEWNEEVIEDYADFSRRTRKELVIARVEVILTGLPTKPGAGV
jgi:N-methylhydantoinase A/oxoprolinase/acetone carboxylase beta subunit